MKLKTKTIGLIGLIGFAAFSLGMWSTFSVGAAVPNCSPSCQSACVARYNSCISSGGSQATCFSRFGSCLSACRCPLP